MERVRMLGYLGLSVSNLLAWREFATELLGMEASEDSSDEALYLRLDEQHHRVVAEPGDRDDIAFTGWQVADERALESVRERLHAAGVKLEEASPELLRRRRVAGLVRFEDPDRIAGEIYYGPLQTFERPFRSPRALSGFVTGDQGLGHIVLAVRSARDSLAFYRDLLGMRLSDRVAIELMPGRSVEVTFLHCNPRHHTLAFVEAPLPKSLLHFMLQVRSLDDVGFTYFLCHQRGAPLATTLGRHTNDHMLSFYVRSPSGFEVEYGSGARTVDDATWQVQTHRAPSSWGHVRLPTANGVF